MGGRMLLLVVVLVGACGGNDPADFSGTFTVNTTNGANGCMFQNWTVGATTTGIPVDITQNEQTATVIVQGPLGTYLDLAIGSRTLIGEVDGRTLEASLMSRDFNQNGCIYKYVLNLRGTLEGDIITGNLAYTTATNGDPNCGALEGCQSQQTFNGARPPTQ